MLKKLKEFNKKKTNKNKVNPIPDYSVDDKRDKLARFPVHTLSNDEKFDIDMGGVLKFYKQTKLQPYP